MSSFCATTSPLFSQLTTAQAEFAKVYSQLTQHPEDPNLLTQAQTCRATLEQALHACESSFPGYKMRELLKARAHEFVPGVEVTLVPPEKDLIVDITSEELDLVYELLGGKEAWERAIRPKAEDFKRMCQWTDPATGRTHDWHINSPYGKMFFPDAQHEFDTIQGLKSGPRPNWLSSMAEIKYGWTGTLVGIGYRYIPLYTNLAVYLRSIHHELLQDEQHHHHAVILTDTATKPQFCGDWSASDDKLVAEQAYGDDALLKALQKLAAPTDPDLAELLEHRFNKSYTNWTKIILPRLNRLLVERFADSSFTITLSLASFYDAQQQYLREPGLTQTDCWEWTRTRLVNDEGEMPSEAGALLSGGSGCGGLSFARGFIVHDARRDTGCRLSVMLKRK